MSDLSDVNALVRLAERQGCKVERTSRHIKVWLPDGSLAGLSHGTGRGRQLALLRRKMRRAGVISRDR